MYKDNKNFWIRKWWNSRTVGNKLDLKCLFIYNLVSNILNQYGYLIGQSKIEKSINYLGRIVIFSLKILEKNPFRKLNKLTYFIEGSMAIKIYQVEIIESIISEYELSIFSIDFRERHSRSFITAEMLSQFISKNNKSFIFSSRGQIRKINNLIKRNNRLYFFKSRKVNIIFKKLL